MTLFFSRVVLVVTVVATTATATVEDAAEQFVRNLQLANFPCDLECRNGGECVYVSQDIEHLKYLARSGVLVQKCICPDGFGGIACDIPVERCLTDFGEPELDISVERPNNPRPEPQQICEYSRLPCDRLPDGSNTCACHVADSVDHRAAGPACRKWNTEYCTGALEVNTATNQLYFCTNGGKCESDFLAAQVAPGDTSVNAQFADAGCQCNVHFYGPHCEYLDWSAHDNVLDSVEGINLEEWGASPDQDKDKDSGRSVMGMAGLVLFLLAAAGLGWMVWVRRRRIFRKAGTGSPPSEAVFRDNDDNLQFTDNRSAPLGNAVVYSDNVMDDVELEDDVDISDYGDHDDPLTPPSAVTASSFSSSAPLEVDEDKDEEDPEEINDHHFLT